MTPKELAESEGVPIALRWVAASLALLQNHLTALAKDEPGDELAWNALETNFSLSREQPLASVYIVLVIARFVQARGVLEHSNRYFHDIGEPDARAIFGDDIPPAYAQGDGVYFTPRFEPYDAVTGRGFGPCCRAAMVLHESIHIIAPRSGEPAIHISEWDEPAFSGQSFEESLHNPSAYASFGAQAESRALEWPRSARFGAGRPAD
ncbi:MAG: hypothetical protein U0271_03105 [Polyangiaceae bacterium]